MLDRQVSPEEIDQEQGGGAGLESWTFFTTSIVSQQRSYGHCLRDSVPHSSIGTVIAWYTSCCAMASGHCLNILLFWRRSTAFLVFRVGACD